MDSIVEINECINLYVEAQNPIIMMNRQRRFVNFIFLDRLVLCLYRTKETVYRAYQTGIASLSHSTSSNFRISLAISIQREKELLYRKLSSISDFIRQVDTQQSKSHICVCSKLKRDQVNYTVTKENRWEGHQNYLGA